MGDESDAHLSSFQSSLILTVVILLFSLVLANVWAQATTTIAVNTAATTPSIDGRWQVDEWSGARVANLTLESNATVGSSPTLRLLHDNTTLYGLVDVPSDNGGTFADPIGHAVYGSLTLTFSNLANMSQSPVWITVQTNHWEIAKVSVICQCSPTLVAWIKSHTNAATSLVPTESSNTQHRIWEFSLRLYPSLTAKPLTQDEPFIGFNAQGSDSKGNEFSLVTGSNLVQLNFAVTLLPEATNVEVILLVTMFVSLMILRKRTKRL